MNNNFLTLIGNALTQMYAAQSGFFVSSGLSIYYSLTVISFFVMGCQAFTGDLTEGMFVKKVFRILIVGWVLSSYSYMVHIPINQAKSMSDQLESGTETVAQNQIDAAMSRVEEPTSGVFPTIGAMVAAAWFWALKFLLAVERLVLIGVMGVSYIAVGIVALLGPMFIPFVLLTHFEFMAWGWFRALVQYCLYQVVASAAVFLNAQVLFGFFNAHPLPWAIGDVPDIAVELIAVVGIAIYVVTLVPRIADSMMGGGGATAVGARTI